MLKYDNTVTKGCKHSPRLIPRLIRIIYAKLFFKNCKTIATLIDTFIIEHNEQLSTPPLR